MMNFTMSASCSLSTAETLFPSDRSKVSATASQRSPNIYTHIDIYFIIIYFEKRSLLIKILTVGSRVSQESSVAALGDFLKGHVTSLKPFLSMTREFIVFYIKLTVMSCFVYYYSLLWTPISPSLPGVWLHVLYIKHSHINTHSNSFHKDNYDKDNIL